MKIPQFNNKSDFDAYFQSEFWQETAAEICRRNRISYNELTRANSSDHIVFLVDDRLVLKIYRPFRNCFEREQQALEFISGKTDLKTPEIVETGKIENLPFMLITQISGTSVTRQDWLQIDEKAQLRFVGKLANSLRRIHELDACEFRNNWAEFVADRAATFIERQIAHGVNRKIIEALPTFIEESLPLVPIGELNVFMHSDFHFGNLRVFQTNGNLEIAGIFDFADSRRGFYEYDFLAIGVLMIQGQSAIQREFFRSYGYAENELDETMRRRLMMLTMLYETADLRRYALRLKPEAVEYSLEELERGIWSFAN